MQVSVKGTIDYTDSDSTDVTEASLTGGAEWTTKLPKVIKKGVIAHFSATGTIEEGGEIKGTIALNNFIFLYFTLNGKDNSATFKQSFGPTINATITKGDNAVAAYTVAR
ncbi:MAG: hypothetical protein HEP71_34385 [Roseivirga sp.]|nr:hypothetical protein [Roseivirga sp.]